MRFRIHICLTTAALVALLLSFSAFAKPLTRKEVSKYIHEGEYDTEQKRPRKHVRGGHKVATNKIKKKKRAPASAHSKIRNRKKTRARRISRARSRHMRLPYAKETPHERDMPFISVPTSRVRKEHKTIVMEDPGEKPASLTPVLPEPLDISEPKSVERIPSSDQATELPKSREPDAFDPHSGADPMRAPGAD